MKEIKRIGISTGGGDCPGLNGVIRAVVNAAYHDYGMEVLGILDSFTGLIYTDRTRELTPADVKDILNQGGTIIGTTNKGNPFKWEREKKDGSKEVVDYSDRVLENFDHLELDALIVIGGDGTQKIAQGFYEKGMPVIGVPKTIDNDLSATDLTFGFDSAVKTATDALDQLHTTARSHHRMMVVEMMGREAGWIALHSGLAGSAHAILIPEIPYDINLLCDHLVRRTENGDTYSIIAVAEGAVPKDGEMSIQGHSVDGTVHLGGVGHKIGAAIQTITGFETRVTVVGHIQRGGSPSAFDRILATRFGEAAVHMAAEKKFGQMVSLQGTAIKSVPLEEAIGKPKRVYPDGTLVKVARSMGVSFGDK